MRNISSVSGPRVMRSNRYASHGRTRTLRFSYSIISQLVSFIKRIYSDFTYVRKITERRGYVEYTVAL